MAQNGPFKSREKVTNKNVIAGEKSEKSKRGLSKRGVAQKVPIGPKKGFRGSCLPLAVRCGGIGDGP